MEKTNVDVKDLEISGVGKPENEVDCRNDKNRWVQEKEHTKHG